MIPGPGGIVWLASYPKSGNTWLRAMLTALLNDDGQTPQLDAMVGSPEFGSRQFLDDICGVDSADLPDWRLPPYLRTMRLAAGSLCSAPTFVKTHDRYGPTQEGQPLFPAEVTRAAIYIVRNPIDVAVSFAAHNSSEVDPAIDRMCNRNYRLNSDHASLDQLLPVDIGGWSDNVLSWLDQAELPVMLVRYEDMLADPANVLGRVAEVAGLTHSSRQLTAAAAACSFDRLRQAEAVGGFDEKPRGMEWFFRSGRSGNGATALSRVQIERIQDHHGDAMARCGYALA